MFLGVNLRPAAQLTSPRRSAEDPWIASSVVHHFDPHGRLIAEAPVLDPVLYGVHLGYAPAHDQSLWHHA